MRKKPPEQHVIKTSIQFYKDDEEKLLLLQCKRQAISTRNISKSDIVREAIDKLYDLEFER